MAASLSDKITATRSSSTSNAIVTTVGTARSIGGTSLACVALTNWDADTAVHFTTYKKTATGAKDFTTQCAWKGIVSGSTIGSLTLKDGMDAGNAVGDFVEMTPTAAYAQDLYDGLTVIHNTDGTLKTGVVATDKLADGAVTAAKIAPQEAWIPVTFKNSWVNFGGIANTCAYMKDTMGFVHLKGLMKSGTLRSAAFTLPAGYRPLAYARFPGMSGGAFASYDLENNGDFSVATGSSTFVTLDGITFLAEN